MRTNGQSESISHAFIICLSSAFVYYFHLRAPKFQIYLKLTSEDIMANHEQDDFPKAIS